MIRRGITSVIEWQDSHSCQLPISVIILALMLAVTLLITRNIWGNPVKEERYQNHASEMRESLAQPNPTVEVINGMEVIWKIPTDSKAVLFLAHGSGGSARNFWARCSTCPKCVGLPEESQVVLDALARKYAVLVISSTEEFWSYGDERVRVTEIIRLWLEKNDLVKIPLVGLGASAGGYFLSVLANDVRFRGIVLMSSEGLFDQMDEIAANYPPTLFVHMPKDVDRRRKIDMHMEILRKAGIEVQEVKCMEFPLTPNWLADRILGLDQTTSSKLFKLFRDKGFIDANGYMSNDGRLIPWKDTVKKNNIALPNGSVLMHHIEEELNLAYAYHEMTSLQSGQIFEWLDLHIRP